MERVPTRHEITRHHDPDPVESPWVDGPPPDEPVAIVAPDPRWPARYRRLAEQIRAALGPVVLDLDHVGSTSVPGLAAKDVIDIDLTVGDPRDWLRSHPDDRESYENAKRAAVPGGGHVMDYNARKQPVIREIYDRMFRAEGLL